MPRLGATVARLNALRRAAAAPEVPSRLSEMRDFGTNPGALVAWTYIPADLPPGAPLVVVLHGCTQSAALYDHGSGWSALADHYGFALLYPEQARANNFNLCFNWYAADDRQRGRGEVASIAQMVRYLVARQRLDPARLFVNGLSAGGAMTAAMLATYPELFAGGAIIAGLPFGIAEGVPEALERMRGKGMPSRGALASRIANASDYRGPWPTLSVWHGTADDIVSKVNAGAIVDQWRDRIGLGAVEGSVDQVDGQRHTVWRDAAGKAMIERYDIEGMGHGVPLASRGDGACGNAGLHMLEAGICSTKRIAAFWGLARSEARAEPRPAIVARLVEEQRAEPAAAPAAGGVGAVIENALRAAGARARSPWMTDQAPSPIRWLARVALPLAIAFAAPAAASPASDRAVILHRVAAMEAAWNRGDFRGYMTGFQNPGVVFVSGGKFTEGVNTRLFRKVRGRWLISVNHVSAYDVPPTAPEAAPGRPSN